MSTNAETKILDGATGTLLWQMAEQQGIEKYATWRYNADHPKLIAAVAKAYRQAGSDIVYSNTFVANRLTVGDTGYKLKDIIASGIKAVQDEGVLCGFSIGPLDKFLEPYGPISEQQCTDIYREVLEIGCEYSPDIIVFETFQDIEMLKIAAAIAKESGVPFLCSMSFDKGGKTLFGTSPAQLAAEGKVAGAAAVGMNCSLGPDKAVEVINSFAQATDLPLLLKPNTQDYSPEAFAEALAPVLGKVAYVGACCGSNPDYIRALRDRV